MTDHHFRTRLVLCALAAMAFGCAVGGPALRQITELQPPRKPVFSEKGGSFFIEWRASSDERSESFAGYNLYLSASSLMFTPLPDLPSPVSLGAAHEYALQPGTNFGQAIYVQIRSRDQKGGVSLPALPEIIIPGTQRE